LEGNPNILAWAALVLCVPVSMFMIARWRAAVSVPLVLVTGGLFLPPGFGFQFPHLGVIDKDILVPLGALLGCYCFRRSAIANARPFRGYDLFIVARVLVCFATCMTNQDPLVFPLHTVAGHSFTSFLSNATMIILNWWPTVFLGRTVIKTSRDVKTALAIYAGGAIVYSFFALIECRLSPQFNVWIYGFRPTAFVMTVRNGGYRPMVFMVHGLHLAFFFAISACAATALGRIKERVRKFRAKRVALYLLGVLCILKSLGSLLYGLLATPLIRFASPRTQTRVATVLALLVYCYPFSRAVGLVPVEGINDFVLRHFGEDRAGSLGLRLEEEEYIMKRALERPWFGWGAGARAFRLDPLTGANTSITDGVWDITFGTEGAFGYAIYFGMLVYPVWRSRRALKMLSTQEDQILVACLAVIGALYLVELIPNSSVDPYTTFLVAALAGIGKRGLEPDEATVPVEAYEAWPEEASTRYA
jgi:hypothetical protein